MPPPRHLILRSVLLTTLVYVFLILPLLWLVYSRKHSTVSLLELSNAVPIGIGLILGVALVWLVLPASYNIYPWGSDSAYPQLKWLGWGHFLLGPLLVILIGNVWIYDFQWIQNIWHSPFRSRIFTFYTIDLFMMVTYLLFFFFLETCVHRHNRHIHSLRR